MTDRAYEPASDDPLAQLAHSEVAPDSSAQPDPDDPLAALARQDGAPQGSSTGAFVRGAEKSVAPAIGSFPAIGAGAEVGAEAGAPFGPLGAAAGGLIGGAAAGFGASALIAKAQNWAIKQLPDSWQDKLGLSDRQEQIDEGEHPTASFLGGLVPYALTLRPGGFGAAADLPENATALQRILAHPATARLFGGAAMGGMELGQEKAEDPNISWPKVAIATAFGMVFNRPTRFGERITELGAQPARAALGRPSPTLAQAADAKVMGPGITEDVFQGTQGQDPVAEGTAQETARQEAATIGTGTEMPPDLHAAARAANPELFAHYDDLLARQRTLQDWFGEGSPVAREHLTATENQIEQVAPEVAAAYRRAAEGAGVATVPGEPFPTMAAMLAARGPEAPPVTPGTSAEALPRPIEAQRDYIRDDVARQLVAAGRPAQEAQAAGAVVAARYEARASRFGGALGSAEELYNREGAEIRGAKAPPPEAPPTAAVPTPTPPLSPVGAAEQPAVTAPATRRGPAYRDPNTFSLLEFLAAHGGIRADDPLIADLKQSFGGKNKFVPGFGQLIRERRANLPGRPLSLDQARQAAVDAGYISDAGEISRGVTQSSIDDLLQAVDREARGEKIYRQGVATRTPAPDIAEANVREREAFIAELDAYAKDHLALTPAERARALEMFDKEGIHEAAEIVDRLALELDNREIESGQAGPRDEAIPGWDVPYEREGSQRPGEAIAPREPGEPGGGAARTGGEGAREEAEPVEYFQGQREGGEPIAEPRELNQQQLGKIRLGGQKPIITLARTADASTFIHESGHAWLEELMRDANHPQAPEDLKTDASTVLNWLGAEKPEGITTRQHEKFARGFEQYLREGVAPSPQLASVFAKFRDWLLRIYQNLRGLGDEISPPIRDVFDRMLAASPQRTVIAPERMERPTLPDIHEADAAHTHPTEAEPIRDRVVAETTSFVQDLPGALQNELATEFARTEPAAEPGTETSGGPEQRGSLGPGGGEPQPVATGGAGGAERGAELPGGSGVEPESVAEPAGGERPGGAKPTDAGLGDKPLAPRPGAFIQGQESKFTDKAGNIRLDTLTNDVDVRQAIKDSARENNDFIGDRRGVVTDGQVMDLAADLGMEGAEKLVKERVIGQAFNAEQVMALRKALIQSATDVSALMKRADAGTDADLVAYAKAKARHQMIQGTVAQATAEAGRAFRAFRNIAGTEGQADINEFLKAATGRTLFQLRQEVRLGATLDTPQKVSKFINDAQNRSFGRMILEYWINGLISGLVTHATYMIGNTLLALEKAGPETAAASAIGRLRTAMGRSGETVRMGEVAEQIKAGVRGFTPAVKAALDAFRSGVTTMLPGEQAAQNILRFPGQEFAAAPMLDEAAKLSDVIASGYSVVRGMRDGLIAGGEIAKAGENAPRLLYSTTGVIPDVRIGGAVLPVGSVIRAPSRFIAAIHSFFRAVNYSMEKNRLAYRMGMNEGLTGTALDSRIGELRQNPSDTMMEQARGEATELTLMGQGGAITQALARLTNTPIFGFPLLKFIDPFVHISSNIINQSIIERTPLGVLSPEIRADLMGKNGNVAQDTAMARMLMGSIYAITLGGLAAEGYVSGSEPADKNQAAIWRMAGNQAHSVRIGDMWYDVHRLGPLGMLLGVAADMQSVSHAISDGDLILAGSNLQHAITQNILDESFMRGPADLIQAIEDPARYGESYLKDQLSSFVPFSVGLAQMARAADPYSRQARSVMDTIKAKVPFESQTLLPRRDIWGDEIANKPAVLAAGITAIYEQRMSRDPVNLALLDLGIYPAQVTRKIRNVQLTDQQYDDYQRIAGRMAKMRLDAIVNSPDYATWPNHIKANVIRETIAQSREAARGMMLMKSPQIARDAVQLRLSKVSGD